jgi:transcriptional regulator with XRE-family HTH domain
MTLGQKLRELRKLEGWTRGLRRPMSQLEVARAISQETGGHISQAYLPQVKNGRRKHSSETTRQLFARLFRVSPGYLVSDLEPVATPDTELHEWLRSRADKFASDLELLLRLGEWLKQDATRGAA